MTYSYSLEPLHSIPDLIPDCVKILKDEWPHCKAELLYELAKTELNGVPCSYGLVQRSDNPHENDILVGHARVIPVTNRERAVCAESLCVDKGKRGQGFGSMAVRKREELAAKLGYRELYVVAYEIRKDYHLRHSYVVYDEPLHTVGANLLQTNKSVGNRPRFVSWHGNVLYPGRESEYEGGAIATEKEVAARLGICFVKYLNS